MPKQTFTFAGILSALVVLGLIGLTAWNRGLTIQVLQEQLALAQESAETNAVQLASSKTALAEAQARVETLLREKEAVVIAQKDIEEQMRSAIQSKDVTISELQGKLTVTMLDRIMFDSGEAVIKPEGEEVLRKIAAVLTQFPNRQIHVIGHTDNVPIRGGSRGCHPTNWELSTARATAAVRFLQENAEVEPRRLAAVGHGEFHPVADNTSPEGRARNRRITLVVLPEELATPETTPITTFAPSAAPLAKDLPPPVSEPRPSGANIAEQKHAKQEQP